MRCGLVWRGDVDMFLCSEFFLPSKKIPSKKRQQTVQSAAFVFI